MRCNDFASRTQKNIDKRQFLSAKEHRQLTLNVPRILLKLCARLLEMFYLYILDHCLRHTEARLWTIFGEKNFFCCWLLTETSFLKSSLNFFARPLSPFWLYALWHSSLFYVQQFIFKLQTLNNSREISFTRSGFAGIRGRTETRS